MLSVASEVQIPNKLANPPPHRISQIDQNAFNDNKSQQSTMSIVNVVTVVGTRRYKRKATIPESPWGHIPKQNWDAAVDRTLLQLGLTKSTVKQGAITGDRPLDDATKYYCHYHGFVKFAYSVGDYSSILMFDEYAPTYCVPPDVHTLVAIGAAKKLVVLDSTGALPYRSTRAEQVSCSVLPTVPSSGQASSKPTSHCRLWKPNTMLSRWL